MNLVLLMEVISFPKPYGSLSADEGAIKTLVTKTWLRCEEARGLLRCHFWIEEKSIARIERSVSRGAPFSRAVTGGRGWRGPAWNRVHRAVPFLPVHPSQVTNTTSIFKPIIKYKLFSFTIFRNYQLLALWKETRKGKKMASMLCPPRAQLWST